MQRGLQWLFLLTFLFPYFILAKLFGLNASIDYKELFWSFKNTLLQSIVSGLGSVGLGIFFSMGYFALRRESLKKVFIAAALAPNFLPPLFILLAVMNLVDPIPRGIIAISFVHTIINCGLCAVMVVGLVENKLSAFADSSFVLGVSRWGFLRQVFLPLLGRDLFFLFTFVFSVCFGSFSVPLILGGGRGTTLQVLIYEKMRISQDWSSALVISFLQSAMLLAIGLMVRRDLSHSSEKRSSEFMVFRSRAALVFFVLMNLALCLGYADVALTGIQQWLDSEVFYLRQYLESLGEPLFNSLFLGLIEGVLVFLVMSLFSFCFDRNWFQRFFDSYTAPSTGFIGFVFLLIWPVDRSTQLLRLSVAFGFIFLPFLFRLYLIPKLNFLQRQVQVAYLMGASAVQIWFKITWPQVLPEIGFAAAISSAWAIGDFALSRMMLIGNDTLALEAETLMTGYRLPMAGVMSFFVLSLGVLTFFFVRRVVDVIDKSIKASL